MDMGLHVWERGGDWLWPPDFVAVRLEHEDAEPGPWEPALVYDPSGAVLGPWAGVWWWYYVGDEDGYVCAPMPVYVADEDENGDPVLEGAYDEGFIAGPNHDPSAASGLTFPESWSRDIQWPRGTFEETIDTLCEESLRTHDAAGWTGIGVATEASRTKAEPVPLPDYNPDQRSA